MIEILATILSRLVNVALCLLITSIALVVVRERTELHLAVVALLALVIGIVGTVAVRYLLTLLARLWTSVFSRVGQ